MDERAAESLTTPGETGRFRPAAMRDLARTAGYAGAGILPTGHRAWRFCRLAP